MNTISFDWNPTGDDTQTFLISNIREDTLQDISNTDYLIQNLEPGQPYRIEANIVNTTTKQESTHIIMDQWIWPTSNIEHLSFTREHGEFFSFSSNRDNDNCTIFIENQLYNDMTGYEFMFDIFTEAIDSNDSVYSQTIEYPISVENLQIHINDLDPTKQYEVYTSLLVRTSNVDSNDANNANNDWYYIYAHEHQLTI